VNARALAVGIMMFTFTQGCGIQARGGAVPVEGPRPGLDSMSGEWSGA
jgi:hypothetical protein